MKYFIAIIFTFLLITSCQDNALKNNITPDIIESDSEVSASILNDPEIFLETGKIDDFNLSKCLVVKDCGQSLHNIPKQYLNKDQDLAAISFLWNNCALSSIPERDFIFPDQVITIGNAHYILSKILNLLSYCSDQEVADYLDSKHFPYSEHYACLKANGLLTEDVNKYLTKKNLLKILTRYSKFFANNDDLSFHNSIAEISDNFTFEEEVTLLEFSKFIESFLSQNLSLCQEEYYRPKVSLNCQAEHGSYCLSENTSFKFTCFLTNHSKEKTNFDHLYPFQADFLDEDCSLSNLHFTSFLKEEIQPQETVKALDFEIICDQIPIDKSFDLAFAVLKEELGTWFYNSSNLSLELSQERFSYCSNFHDVEGWICDDRKGYPLWLFAPYAEVTVLKGSGSRHSFQMPSGGYNLNFSCTDLPASLLISQEGIVKAWAYGHELPRFSVWRDFPFEISLNPSHHSDFLTGKLEVESKADDNILIRLPYLDGM